MGYPRMFSVRQKFSGPPAIDITATVEDELSRLHLKNRVMPGQTVAITAGSRGIANIHIIIRTIAEHFKNLGARPFIVPAMGSHGGGTADGQRRIIESYGITESFCGCPIRSSMETVVLCETPEGIPVHFDRHAWKASHVVVCARVKPHTDFSGDIESGLLKMLMIGLGKHAGASVCHQAIQQHGFGHVVRSVAQEVIGRCSILCGLAIIENTQSETAKIESILPCDFEEREKYLLKLARLWMPRLPFNDADILLIDEIGKNISGAGMDTNIVGRKASGQGPQIRRIVVRGLSLETHGNACGIGLADYCRSQVVREMDAEATRINCITGGRPESAEPPPHFETDREILDAAGLTKNSRLMWIRNTSEITDVRCSEDYYKEARRRADLEVGRLRAMQFDETGNLWTVT